jgi:L-ascorbate metabolism protein UlaG (beta-lactamase superfamily)
LPRHVPVFVPLGLGNWFRRLRFTDVRELDWWETAKAGTVSVTLVPAQHWSRRRIGDTNRTLWGGFVIECGGLKIYHCGDSAWFDGFAEIGRRHPDLLAAMLPIGSYSPAWFMGYHHMNPEEAGHAFLELGARHLIPMHWGTFKLTDEPLLEPAERMRRWWDDHAPGDGRKLTVPAVGQTVLLDE